MKRVLVVDDNRDVRTGLKILLGYEGYDVSEAATADDIVDVVLSTVPDVILLDVMMPGVDGFEALRLLKSNRGTRSVPVIMVTARGQQSDMRSARALAAADYIVKPWARGEVEARVARVFGEPPQDGV